MARVSPIITPSNRHQLQAQSMGSLETEISRGETDSGDHKEHDGPTQDHWQLKSLVSTYPRKECYGEMKLLLFKHCIHR